ncbi:MAG: hypothetical protein M0Q42_04660 [Xanthomonadales bacterium]|nr:hypothetical protein [Xanthomonadales bacterium]
MIALVAAVVYLVLVHGATLTGSQGLHLAAVALLVVGLLVMLHGQRILQLLLILAVAGLIGFTDDPGQWLLYAAPVLFPLMIAAGIGRSLLPGRMPVIERMMWHVNGCPEELDRQHRRYARGVTLYWCLVLVAMALMNGLLAIYADPVTWSWISNIASYAVPVLAMLAEYAVRSLCLPRQAYRNFFDFMIRLIRLGPTLARELAADWRDDRSDASPATRS